ncbi:hypothetical protein [Leptolyngbya sp. NM2-A1]
MDFELVQPASEGTGLPSSQIQAKQTCVRSLSSVYFPGQAVR